MEFLPSATPEYQPSILTRGSYFSNTVKALAWLRTLGEELNQVVDYLS